MSSVLSSEVGIAPLPVTGAGPFSMLIGIIGVASVGVGALLARVARRETVEGVASGELGAGGWSDEPISSAAMADAVHWLNAQLASPPPLTT